MICLQIILLFQNLLIWQNNYMKQKMQRKNSELVEEIKNRWSNLKYETKKMSEEEIKGEIPNQILEIVNEILDFNKEIKKTEFLVKNTNTKPNA